MSMNKQLAVFGLGKMGKNLARNLSEKGWRVVAWNRTYEITKTLKHKNIHGVATIADAVRLLSKPRVMLLMVPNGKPVDDLLFGKEGVTKYLQKGDYVIDAGNSYFEDTKKRAQRLTRMGFKFLDVGTSGGPGGARNGACMMIGGVKKDFEYLEPLFRATTVKDGYAYVGTHGAGHFVKMVHNGIEYGMMQAIAEGFALMKKSPYKVDLRSIAKLYNHGSVIESRLVGWLEQAFTTYGVDLRGVSGSVAHTGEGEWTVKTAKKLRVPTPIIQGSLDARLASSKKPSFTGQILMGMRNQFGGHAIKS